MVVGQGWVELRDWRLDTQIGTYGPGDTVPDAHLLDMTLQLQADRILVAEDGMGQVFDYDPLVAEIDRLARDGHYDTQEWLLTRILRACAACPEVQGVTLALRKTPVRAGSGSLGVRLQVDEAGLQRVRQALALPAHL
jgi:dihydroneopterin aldolase